MAPNGQLRTALRKMLLDGMIRRVKPKGSQWKVLVVDREALRILAAAVQLTELVNEGVTIVEMLDLRREPLPRLPAIYFITPTAESISLFTSENKSQYREYHLFFTGRLPDYQMEVIRQNRELLRRVRNLVEINISLLAYESRLFSLDRPAGSLPHLFGNDGGLSHRDAVSEMSLISERLTDACVLVGQSVQWTVRADASSHVSRTISSLVKEQLETLRIDKMAKAPKAEDADAGENAPKKATLIILDRATDVITPLIHEFSYQAMLHDLVKLDYRKPGGAHYQVGELDGKNLPIDDEDRDPVWGTIRHKFIEDAKRLAARNMQHFLDTNPAFKIGKQEAADIDIADMTKAVRNLPEAQMQRDRYVMHLSAMKECMEHVGAMKIPDLALLEQELALGSHPDGTRCASKTMAEKLLEILQEANIPVEHRIRTLLIALAVATEDNIWMGGEASLLCQSTPFKQKMRDSRLLNLPGLGRDLIASIHGLRKILTFTKTSSVEKGPEAASMAGQYANRLRTKVKERKAYRRAEKETSTRRGRRMLDDPDAVPFDVARYTPPMRGIVADLVSDVLDNDDFPVTGAVDVDSIINNIINKQTASPDRERDETPRGRQVISRGMDAFSALRNRDSDEDFEVVPAEADPDHLYMVFIVGGVCYSEVRSVYEVCDKRGANIIVGGTHVLTPRMFLGALGGIADPAMKIKVLLPPLPLDLAMMRQDREKTMKAMREQDKKEEQRKQSQRTGNTSTGSQQPSPSSGSPPTGSSVSSASGAGGDEIEVVQVESYRKPSRMKRWLRGKK